MAAALFRSDASLAPEFPRFSDREYRRRERLVRKMLEREGLQGLLVYAPSANSPGTVSYLSNYSGPWPAHLVFPYSGEPTLLLHFRNHVPCAKDMAVVKDIRWHGNDPAAAVGESFRRHGLERSRIGVVSLGTIPHAEYESIVRMTPGTELVDVSRQYNWIRWVRSDEELTWIRRSAALTDMAARALKEETKPGLTEHDLNAIVHKAVLGRAGLVRVGFLTATSMSAPSVYVPWQFPRKRRVRRGDVLITEMTVSYYGYQAQLHRPFVVGAEPTPRYQALFDVALECFNRVARSMKPGATAEDVVKASSVIEESGFTSFDSLVHGEGGKDPELGSGSSGLPAEDFTFRKGMVVVIQPQPVTRDMKAGLQLGAACLIAEDGAHSLHRFPFEFTRCA